MGLRRQRSAACERWRRGLSRRRVLLQMGDRGRAPDHQHPVMAGQQPGQCDPGAESPHACRPPSSLPGLRPVLCGPPAKADPSAKKVTKATSRPRQNSTMSSSVRSSTLQAFCTSPRSTSSSARSTPSKGHVARSAAADDRFDRPDTAEPTIELATARSSSRPAANNRFASVGLAGSFVNGRRPCNGQSRSRRSPTSDHRSTKSHSKAGGRRRGSGVLPRFVQ